MAEKRKKSKKAADTPDGNAEEFNFEEALQTLEQTVAQLESGDLTLEASLKLYEDGRKLAEQCQAYLENAALRVEHLTEDGEIAPIGLEIEE